MALALGASPQAAAEPRPPRDLPAASWILIDAATGDVLAAKDPDSPYPVASATKLMTYLVAASELSLNDEIVAAPYKASAGESLAGFETGDRIGVPDALYGLILASGNDAATTLALAAAGSEPDFVSRMNQEAERLGLDETEYLDPIGLDPANISSARDLVELTTELRKDGFFREVADTARVVLRSPSKPITLVNRNRLVLDEPFVDGVKTGATAEAGFVLVGSGERRGVGLVSAVLGAPDENARDAVTLELLEYGFSLYEERELVAVGEALGSVPTAAGGRLRLEASEGVSAVARGDQRVRVRLDGVPRVVGPVRVGDVVTTAKVRLGGLLIAEIDAVASRAVPARLSERDEKGLPHWAYVTLVGAALVAVVLAALALASRRSEQR